MIRFPKVGDIFYWVDSDGDVHEDTCLKIDYEDREDIEKLFFTHLTPNGGGIFVSESTIISSNDTRVIIYKEAKAKEQANEVANFFNNEKFRSLIYSVLNRHFGENNADEIIEVLSNKENYEH